MESFVTIAIFILLVVIVGVPYWIKTIRQRKEAEQSRTASEQAGLHEPPTLHPKIDLLTCIGCASCVRICPEDVLGIVDGRASVIHGTRCVSHALCAEVCPVGAITMGFGKPQQGMEIPHYDDNYMSNVGGIYICGELSGLGLIKNAFGQSRKAVEHISSTSNMLPFKSPTVQQDNAPFDVIIVGAGPAGIGAGLACKELGLRYLILEQDDLGGSILHYPRNKIVLTSPFEIPLYGKIKSSEMKKEELLSLLTGLVTKYSLQIASKSKVEKITKEAGFFTVETPEKAFRSRTVILAIGRRGTPRKLNVPGEELPKVYYRLMEAEQYTNRHLLVVGGGDSAIEATVALVNQKGNTVTLSYRRDSFVRLKVKNEKKIKEAMGKGMVTVLFNSEVHEITTASVTLKLQNDVTTIPNDFVFVFAGGELPAEFLEKTGITSRNESL